MSTSSAHNSSSRRAQGVVQQTFVIMAEVVFVGVTVVGRHQSTNKFDDFECVYWASWRKAVLLHKRSILLLIRCNHHVLQYHVLRVHFAWHTVHTQLFTVYKYTGTSSSSANGNARNSSWLSDERLWIYCMYCVHVRTLIFVFSLLHVHPWVLKLISCQTRRPDTVR